MDYQDGIADMDANEPGYLDPTTKTADNNGSGSLDGSVLGLVIYTLDDGSEHVINADLFVSTIANRKLEYELYKLDYE